MADRPCKGQLGAWQGLGRGQGPRSGRGPGSISAILTLRGQNLRSEVRFLVSGSDFWSQGSKFEGLGRILVNFGRFGTFLGPCPESEKFGYVSGTSQKDGSTPGDFDKDLDGRAILGSKI